MSEELKTRMIWGLGLAVGVLVVLFFLPDEFAFFTALVAGMLGWREYARMMDIGHRKSLLFAGYALLAMSFTIGFFVNVNTLFWLWLSWTLGFLLLFIEESQVFFPKSDEESISAQRLWTELCRFVMGNIYIFMLFGFIGPIVGRKEGDFILLLAFAVVFVGDSAAYFAGKRWGKKKLWPLLSPGKTLEGAIGGFAGSVVASLTVWGITKAIPGTHLSLIQCLAVGVLASPLAQAGDLVESLMKRAAGQKDSGTLVPGHGGILDRADGLVFVMPLIHFLF